MNRRHWRWCLGGSVLCFLVLGALFAYHRLNRGPLCYENFDSIREGMTRGEVEKLLGCGPGDHSTGTVHVKMPLPDGSLVYQPMPFSEIEMEDRGQLPVGKWETWYGDRGLIAVSFDPDKKVLRKQFLPGRRLPPDWWLFLEWRFGFEDVRHHSP